MHWLVFKNRRSKNDKRKYTSRSGFSLPRDFRPWSRIYRSPSGSLRNWFFVSSYWTFNPAVFKSSGQDKCELWSTCASHFYWFGRIHPYHGNKIRQYMMNKVHYMSYRCSNGGRVQVQANWSFSSVVPVAQTWEQSETLDARAQLRCSVSARTSGSLPSTVAVFAVRFPIRYGRG